VAASPARPNLLAQTPLPGSTREDRIRLLLAAAVAMRDGGQVPRDAARFLSRALSDWLDNGGSLERDHLRVSAVAGSHATPRVIALRLQAETAVDLGETAETLRFSSRGEQEPENVGTVTK
jgi:hypothetical protein